MGLRIKRSTMQSVPASPVSLPSSVNGLNRAEAATEPHSRSSSERGYLLLPSIRSYIPFCPELRLRTRSPSLSVELRPHASTDWVDVNEDDQSPNTWESLENIAITPKTGEEATENAKIEVATSQNLIYYSPEEDCRQSFGARQILELVEVGAETDTEAKFEINEVLIGEPGEAAEPRGEKIGVAKLRTVQPDIFDTLRGSLSENSVPPLDITPPLDLNTRVCSMSYSGDSALDSFRRLPSRPKSPSLAPSLELADDGTSFDDLVRDLIQNEPDIPIGGKQAPAMATKPTLAVGSLPIHNKTPQHINTPASDIPGCCGEQSRPKRNEAHSESSNGFIGLMNRPMMTAPETPERCRSPTGRNGRDADECSEKKNCKWIKIRTLKSAPSDKSGKFYTSKFPGSTATHIKDFGRSHKLCVELESQLNPSSNASNNVSNLANLGDGPFSMGDAVPAPKAPVAPPTAVPEPPTTVSDTTALPDSSAVPQVPNTEALPGASALPNTDAFLGASALSEATNTAEALPAVPNVPDIPDLPDVSGVLDVPNPALPASGGTKPSRARRALNKGKRYIRKARPKLLRKRVLMPIVGRQLAGPTSDALKMISDGLPVDPNTIIGAVSPPGGLPATPIPA